jgi:D-glycero-D-manno-heptose 1,7-bisphosphate phosphatase
MSQPAIFLDRDGTLMDDPGYVGDPALVRVVPRSRKGVASIKRRRLSLVIITNQSGIARGKFTIADFEAVQAPSDGRSGTCLIDATYMCPDGPAGESGRRKPSPAMILEATRDLALDLVRSWMIGDKDIDVQVRSGGGCASDPGAERTGGGSDR